ncbi:cystatin-A5-like [Hoplias malabaricus]|uniref:cystatin-A5-like n=1 Tax=Hoplias malabaricus TaxID=27720 RepID=UPI003462B1ED
MASRFCLLLVVVLFAVAESAPNSPVLGGWSKWKNADKSVNEICKNLQPEVESTLGRYFSPFKALTYQDQLVAGWNYKIKVYGGVNKLVIMEVHQNLTQYDSLTDVTVFPYPNANF